jgi:hypothetical protein
MFGHVLTADGMCTPGQEGVAPMVKIPSGEKARGSGGQGDYAEMQLVRVGKPAPFRAEINFMTCRPFVMMKSTLRVCWTVPETNNVGSSYLCIVHWHERAGRTLRCLPGYNAACPHDDFLVILLVLSCDP